MPADDAPEARRILLIRPTALGDVARTVHALVTLRQAHPQAHIDWLVNDSFADVVRHHPGLNGVLLFSRSRFARLHQPAVALEVLRWLGDLRQRRYDLVVDLQGLFRSGFFTWMTRAPRRIGFGNAAELGWLGYNRRHVIDRRWHAVDRMAGLLEAQGYTPSRDLTLYCGESDLRWRRELLGDGGEPYALVAPVARWRSKTWPADRFADLIARLLQSQLAGPRVVVLASPTEQAAIAPIVQRYAGDARVLLPRTTVGQMMALIAGARVVVCNDSGPLHVAVGFQRAITAIFGPTDRSLVGPYGRDECVVQPPGIGSMGGRAYRRNPDDQSLISQVTLDRVWEHVERQVKGSGSPALT